MRKLVEIKELPVRARRLDDEDLRKIFGGGCTNNGGHCMKHKDCCSQNCYSAWLRACAPIEYKQ